MSTLLRTKEDVLNFLQNKGIQYKLYEHREALPMEDWVKEFKGFENRAPFQKNLLFNDSKQGLQFIILEWQTKINDTFWTKLKSKKGNVRLASEDKMQKLCAQKGSTSIFNIFNDTENIVKNLVFDKKLNDFEYWSFHPQDICSSVELKKEDVLNLLKEKEIQFRFEDLEESVVTKQEQAQEQDLKGQTLLKITSDKTSQFPEWYSQIIIKANLIDYYNISGCYILKPEAYFIWEQIMAHLDSQFKQTGVDNVYFPMFVSRENLEKEESHLEGFKAEVAWVTHYGDSELQEPVAIRPTSETIMYPTFSKWVQSHRDLPILINQWTNIVRWEFKHPTPFVRTREFLWQEGHTAHSSKEEAEERVYQMLDCYEKTYKELLCIPVIKGTKSENEKFGGADFTTTCETFIPETGRAIQACTSHMLGQNFAKMFDITFQDKNKEKQYAYQTSWGFTTRSIGILVMLHGDNQGLVLPPGVAKVQVVVIPIIKQSLDSDKLDQYCYNIVKELKKQGIRVQYDDRDSIQTGRKYNEWEMKGTPIRIEIGEKELEQNQFKLARRFDGHKENFGIQNCVEVVQEQLKFIKEQMYNRALQRLQNRVQKAENWQQFMGNLNKLFIVKTWWCNEKECENEVKLKSKNESSAFTDGELSLSGSAKTLCMPFEQEKLDEDQKCFNCEKKAKAQVIWGRSY